MKQKIVTTENVNKVINYFHNEVESYFPSIFSMTDVKQLISLIANRIDELSIEQNDVNYIDDETMTRLKKHILYKVENTLDIIGDYNCIKDIESYNRKIEITIDTNYIQNEIHYAIDNAIETFIQDDNTNN